MSIPLNKKYGHRVLVIVTLLFVTLLGVMVFVVPPGVDPDSCWGFLVMHSMQLGHGFNLLPSPDPFNIAKNRFEFLAWWSPGQYMVPWFFKIITGLQIGKATSLAVALSSLIGLPGFYQLFKKLGFSNWIVAISITFIATQRFFIAPYLYYRGGDVLIFAFVGWFLYGCFSFKKISWQVFVFIFFSGLTGFFLKSSFMWMYAAGLACLWINISSNQTPTLTFNKKHIWLWLKNGLLLAIPFITATIIIYKCYLLKGDTPAANTGTALIVPETFSYPLASPFLSAFSVDTLTGGLLYHPEAPMISYHWALVLIFVAAALTLIYLLAMVRLSPDKRYPTAIIAFYLVALVFFGYMYLMRATVSYEDRHFQMLGLLFIPGFVHLCFKTNVSKVMFIAFWAAFIVLDIPFIKGGYTSNRDGALGKTGLSQQVYEQAVIDEMLKLDASHKNNALFVLSSPDLALELTHNRVLIIDGETPDVVMKDLTYRGTAGTIYVLFSNADATNGRQNYILKSFVNYRHFIKKQLTADYYLYTATD